ncbi:MAG TPA: hypothetical protein VFB78_17665 [Acidimicrobiales bacterium]|nr:hypothetical protein [Acidimicrobiales bacterium]
MADPAVAVSAVSAVAGLAAVAFTARQVRISRAQTREIEVGLRRDLRQTWRDLTPQWGITLMLTRGPDDFYTPIADRTVRERFREVEALRAASRFGSERLAQVASEEESARRMKLGDQAREREHEFELAARDVLLFLGELSLLLLRGDVSPSFVFSIVGIDVVRNVGAIRPLMQYSFDEKLSRMSTGEHWYQPVPLRPGQQQPDLWTAWLDYYPGLRDRLFVLIDVMHAEAVRNQELGADEMRDVADHKRRTGSGRSCRDRVWATGARLRERRVARRLMRLLLQAEFVRVDETRLAVWMRRRREAVLSAVTRRHRIQATRRALRDGRAVANC